MEGQREADVTQICEINALERAHSIKDGRATRDLARLSIKVIAR